MDFHFYEANSSSSSTKSTRSLKRTLSWFVPVFALAAILPALLVLVTNPVTLRFQSQAASNELSLWLTPENVEAKVGETVTLRVVGFFDSDTKLIPSLTVPIIVDGSGAIENKTIEYKVPFRGQVTLGEVKIYALKAGTIVISADTDSVVAHAYSDPLPITHSSATIIVK